MALLSCRDLRVSWGGRALLDHVGLQIESGERIGLVGRNGEGKSTLLSVLSGRVQPDQGEIVLETGVRVALLEQQVPDGLFGTVGDLVRAGLMGDVKQDHPVQRLCSLLQIDSEKEFQALSGGLKRKALLARALVSEPDLLLLDEPTNHLDLETIKWLETFLLRLQASLLFVTHDRSFLQRLSTRIIELDRGRLTSWSCDYPTYLRRKEELLVNEEKEWALQDKVLAKEEEWIRQGIKARRTRNEGRVRALKALRAEREERRTRVGQVRLRIQRAERSWTKVITARNLSFHYPDAPIVEGLSTTILRGDKIGIIGPNGCGKTTLLNLLLGKLVPSGGTVKHGGTLEIAHFDQNRETLREDLTIVESVTGSSHVVLDGERRHVASYLQDFLFPPDQAHQPVSTLSGGERNRLLLARLFTRPANVLVLDEPTNDLDLETLELLEDRLLQYNGTVLLVSHDRSFLDNLCTSTLVFEGKGIVKEYVGGYSDWRRVAERQAAPSPRKTDKPRPPRPKTVPEEKAKPLSFRERMEREAIPSRIEALEEELALLHETMAAPEFYRGDPEAIRRATEESRRLPKEIEALYSRWAELDR